MSSHDVNRQSDPRALRMMEKFASRRFQSTRANQRLRFVMSWWVIRNKIVSNLKRGLDTTVACVMIVFSSPIMLITALAIKLDSPGPIFFQQVRVGKDGELQIPINVY
jgi:lipopolysaccharide/colanic/teichoic acid biosynthesis glycosyltransferase